MENQIQPNTLSANPEGIDVDKLKVVVSRNIPWIIGLFLVVNFTAYLTLRWTKDVYESESEMKLDVKQDATELGIKAVVEDQNLNIISGEIEQIKSKVFLNEVINALDIEISYYSIGKVLVDEKYKYGPVSLSASYFPEFIKDIPFYLNFLNTEEFEVKPGDNGQWIRGAFGKPLAIGQFTFTLNKKSNFDTQASDDYYFIVNSREKLLEQLSKNLTVEPLNFNANTIRIAFQDYNPLKAYTIVNKIDSLYIRYSNDLKNRANRQKIDWLNNELRQVESKMEGYESYFENFTLRNKSSSADEDLKRTIFFISRLDSQRYELDRRITGINGLMASLSSGSPDLSIAQKQFLPEYINKDLELLLRVIAERNKLSLAYNENTFAFKQKENEAKALRDQLFNQLVSLKNGWLENMAEVVKRKEDLEQKFAGMPDKNTQFSKNQRYYKLYEEFYLLMMQSKAQFEIAQAGNTPDFKILSPATMPAEPIAPQKWLIMGIGLVASLVLNFLFIGMAYLLNNKVISLQEVEKNATVPVLGSIPAFYGSTENFWVVENPKSIVSEAIRALRTSLDFFTAGQRKVISISSTVSGEGKSFLAMNLGAMLATSHKKVVLLDLDMRKGKVKLPMTVTDTSKGMSTILIQKHSWSDCILKTPVHALDYIPSGPHPPNPAELLLNGAFDHLITQLKEHYDFIVMDTPPIGLVTDGIMVMRKSDVSLFVFRANYSKKEFIQNLSRLIRINKLSHVAAVVNALPSNGKNYGYGYYEDVKPSSLFKRLLSR